jgi:hypothetical protein
MSKSDLVIPDKYVGFYKAHKAMNPSQKLYWAAFKKNDVDTIDHLVEISKGKRETIKSQKDWEIVSELLDFFAQRWPEEFKDFKQAIPDIRKSRRAGGYSKSKEIKYVGAFPPRFERLLRVIFPLQQFNKDFVNKLVKRIPLFKVGGET